MSTDNLTIAIVIPHHLSDLEILSAWSYEFNRPNVHIFLIEDKDSQEVTLPASWQGQIHYYNHQDIKKELGKNSWIIPFKTSAIRSYGYYKAWQIDPDVILTVDNDCFPERGEPYWIDGHIENLNRKVTLDWMNTAPDIDVRGLPYKIRNKSEVVVSHGLWSNIPDLDAPTQLLNPDFRLAPAREVVVIPRYNFYPHCGMNFGWNPKITPLMYFGIQGPSFPYDRFDDMWAGLFFKKILDHLGLAVVSGYPSVHHAKQSDVYSNLKKETPGIILHEQLWVEVQKIELTGTELIPLYRELLAKLPDLNDYIAQLKVATNLWLDLFEEAE